MKRHILAAGFSALALLGANFVSADLRTAFTYQGQLRQQGNPVNDPAIQMSFSLYDAASGGNLIGGPLIASVAVADGVFSTELDFGSDAFNGQQRWLEITVGGTTLSPRQEVTGSPYALHTRGLNVDASGRVGIGTEDPGARLHVGGTPGVDGLMFPDGTLQTTAATSEPQLWQENGANIHYSTGNVGIGTATPAVPLNFANALGNKISLWGQGGDHFGFGIQPGQMQLYVNTPGGNIAFGYGSSDSFTELMRLSGNGNLGIGTNSPSQTLTVAGDALLRGGEGWDGNGDRARIHLGIEGNQIDGVYGSGLHFSPWAVPDAMVIREFSGNVGIGTTNPAVKLDVNGSTRMSGLTLTGNNAGTGRVLTSDASGNASWQNPPASGGEWATDGVNIYNTNGGNVGIGTDNPVGSLDVVGGVRARGGFPGLSNTQNNGYTFNGSGDDDSGMFCPGDGELSFLTNASERLKITSGGLVKIGAGDPQMSLQVDQNSPTFYNAPAIGGFNGFTGWLYMHIGSGDHSLIWNHQAALRFGTETSPAAGYSEKMRISANGDVGIGTSSPATKLDVNGTVRGRIVQVTGGADLAEPYDVADAGGVKPIPGMLVSIDAEHIGKLRISSAAYDRSVAGIISGANGINPGLVLRQEGTIADGEWPVATAGRVWCYCDADVGGAIEPGDLVTTSAVAGHGMRAAESQRCPGAVVGKAMSRLEHGRGLVLVLVSLQ